MKNLPSFRVSFLLSHSFTTTTTVPCIADYNCWYHPVTTLKICKFLPKEMINFKPCDAHEARNDTTMLHSHNTGHQGLHGLHGRCRASRALQGFTGLHRLHGRYRVSQGFTGLHGRYRVSQGFTELHGRYRALQGSTGVTGLDVYVFLIETYQVWTIFALGRVWVATDKTMLFSRWVECTIGASNYVFVSFKNFPVAVQAVERFNFVK